MNNKKNSLIYVLGGIVAVLLLTLVGMLAYNYGKEKSNEKVEAKNDTETVTVTPAQAVDSTATSMPQEDSPKPKRAEPEEDMRNIHEWHLTGTVAGQRVVMDLYNDYGNLSGSYYYEKYKPSSTLQLSGNIDYRGNVYLDEYNTKEDYYSGYFECRITSKGTIKGSITNSRGNTYPVKLNLML